VLLRLLSLILNDASDQHIEEQLKRLPYLTLTLLRVVNSVAYGTVKKDSSVSQCLVMLGRRQLQRWVQVMLYASSQQAMAQNPLLHTAVVRARVMEPSVEDSQTADSRTGLLWSASSHCLMSC
jgi:c-di-GMP-related signal transduction protein